MRWFVNWKFDLFFFFMPYWVVWALLLALPKEYLSLSFGIHAPLLIWLLIDVVLDGGHAWLTLQRTFWDQAALKNHGKYFLFGIPLICFAVLFFLSLWSVEITLRFLFYATFYHGIKQLFGITSLYFAQNIQDEAKATPASFANRNKVKRWDKLILTGSFYLPFFYWHFHMPESETIPIRLEAGWFIETFIPQNLHFFDWSSYSLLTFKLISSAAIAYWLYLNLTSLKNIQWAKIFWTLTNIATFYIIFVVYPFDFLIFGCLLAVHAIAYFGIMALYQFRQEKKSIAKFCPKYLLALLPILTFAAIQVYFVQVFVFQDRANDTMTSLYQLSTPVLASPVLFSLLISTIFLVNVSHYVFDAYIWRFNSKNPQLASLLITRKD
jgi:hypothetical protein